MCIYSKLPKVPFRSGYTVFITPSGYTLKIHKVTDSSKGLKNLFYIMQ